MAGGNGTAGGDTWFSTSSTVIAKGGGLGPANSGTGGTGGSTGNIGDVTFAGGNGGDTATATGGAGGGSAAGSTTAGRNGGNAVAGGNGAVRTAEGTGGTGGGGGNGGTSTSGDGGSGGYPGGGGGAAGSGASNNAVGAAGANGEVVITYLTTSVGKPTTNVNLANAYTTQNVGNVTVDDGDYFVEFGSEYIIQEYKRKWINNTDNIAFTWAGRSTESTVTSPLLIQIYNVNSATWETLAQENRIAADTDFTLQVSKTTNVGNYYASDNTVTFRAYQQVI